MPIRLAAALTASVLGPPAFADEGPPNVVLILADDLGWADLGCYAAGSTVGTFETPHIDRLAAAGVRFTDFYAACPVCSPTRAAVQSGQYQARLRLTDFVPGHWRPFEKLVVPAIADHLPLAVETPAELLRRAGYRSGYFGKWHLGNPPGRQPADQGYHVSNVYSGHWLPRNVKQLKPGESQKYATDVMAAHAREFIKDQKDGPFFLFLAPYAVHIPLHAKPKTIAKYEQKLGGKSGPEGVLPSPVYAAMVEHLDDLVGSVTATLEEAGVADNTLIIFTSDNGGLYKMYTGQGDRVTDNGPLRGEKGTLYEGGIRVPLIVHWPGRTNAGSVCGEPALSIDFWPTLAQIAGVGPNNDSQHIDGESLLPLFDAPDNKLRRDAIYWHYPHYHHMDPAGAVRARDWKLVRHYDGRPDELFRLSEDIGEQHNLASSHPAKATELRGMLDDWLLETDALLPTPNTRHDSDRAAEWWSRRSGRPLNMDNSRWATDTQGPAKRGRQTGSRRSTK